MKALINKFLLFCVSMLFCEQALTQSNNGPRQKSGVKRHWTKYHFINVMLHELGHALGIPHLYPKTQQNPKGSELMTSQGFPACDAPEYDVCNHQDVDFEAFLWSYDPEDAYVGRRTVIASCGDPWADNMRAQGWNVFCP